MDHLPTPINPIAAPLRVPLVCDGPYEDADGEWLLYPAKAGWPQVLPSPQYPQWSLSELNKPSDDRALERFFQRWIFFGLLHRVLGEYGLYDGRDYVGADAEGHYVHTRKLAKRLRAWQEVVRPYTPAEKERYYERLLPYLYRADDSLAVLGTPLGPAPRHPGFNPAIKVSLAALGHSLVCVIDNALLQSADSRSPNGWAQIGWLEAREREMVLHGWCPSEIGILRRDFQTLSSQWYCQHLRRPFTGAYHSGCHAEQCQQLQIDPRTYRTGHVARDCTCSSLGGLGPDKEEVLRCLRSPGDMFPVLRIVGQTVEDVSIETVPFRQEEAYVALSHVWADGLGNQNANELPRCQLLKLRSLIRKLQGIARFGTEKRETRDLLLWCDTLCCPVEAEPKKLALAQMAAVYTEAAYVLVLDRTLEIYAYDEIGPIEAAIRVFTSRWYRRIWTLQEAVLAGSLLIHFADRAVDLRELWQNVRTAQQGNLNILGIGIDLQLHCRSVRYFYHIWSNESAGSDLPNAVKAVRYRRVSVLEDEPLCLNTLLRFRSKPMADALPEKRMELLWRTMPSATRGIPNDIVFNALSRLDSTGFRWAPASVQQPVALPPQLVITKDSHRSAQGTLTERGLKARFPAWRIQLRRAPSGLPHSLWDMTPASQNLVHCRSSDGKWYYILRTAQQLAGPQVTTYQTISGDEEYVLILNSEVGALKVPIGPTANFARRSKSGMIHAGSTRKTVS